MTLLANLLAIVVGRVYASVMTRRGWGDDAIYWVARRRRYVGAASLGYGPDGKRLRKVVSGKTKQEVKDKLKTLHEALAHPVRSPRDYTLGLAVEDWLGEGMTGRSAQTVSVFHPDPTSLA
jgi:hypothetical protein